MMITQKIFFSGEKFLFTIRSKMAMTGSRIAIPIKIKDTKLSPSHIIIEVLVNACKDKKEAGSYLPAGRAGKQEARLMKMSFFTL